LRRIGDLVRTAEAGPIEKVTDACNIGDPKRFWLISNGVKIYYEI